MEAAALESSLASGSSAVLNSAFPCSCRPSSLPRISSAGVALRHQCHSAQLTKGEEPTIIVLLCGDACQALVPFHAADQLQTGCVRCDRGGEGSAP